MVILCEVIVKKLEKMVKCRRKRDNKSKHELDKSTREYS